MFLFTVDFLALLDCLAVLDNNLSIRSTSDEDSIFQRVVKFESLHPSSVTYCRLSLPLIFKWDACTNDPVVAGECILRADALVVLTHKPVGSVIYPIVITLQNVIQSV